MILDPETKKGQKVRVKSTGRTGVIDHGLGMLAYVKWDDTGEITTINGAWLEEV